MFKVGNPVKENIKTRNLRCECFWSLESEIFDVQFVKAYRHVNSIFEYESLTNEPPCTQIVSLVFFPFGQYTGTCY